MKSFLIGGGILIGLVFAILLTLILLDYVWSDAFKKHLTWIGSRWPLNRLFAASKKKKMAEPSVDTPRTWFWGFLVTLFQIYIYVMVGIAVYDLSEFGFRLFEYGLAEIFGSFGWLAPSANFSWVFSTVLSIRVVLRFIAQSYKWFTLYVPEYMAAITVNQMTGERRKYPAGSFRKMPWEAAITERFYSLELISVDIPSKFPTGDGGVATNRISVRYKPEFKNLDIYAQVDEVTIATGMADGAKTIATELIGRTPTRKVTSQLSKIRDSIDATYKAKRDSLESAFGIEFDSVGFSDVVFAKETQETLDTMFSTESLLSSHKDDPAMRNDILTLQTKGKVNKEIKELKLDLGGTVAPELVKLFNFIFDRFGKSKEAKGGTT